MALLCDKFCVLSGLICIEPCEKALCFLNVKIQYDKEVVSFVGGQIVSKVPGVCLTPQLTLLTLFSLFLGKRSSSGPIFKSLSSCENPVKIVSIDL